MIEFMLPVSAHFRLFPHIPLGLHSQEKHDDDDKIDSGKLAALLRGGYLRAVYHSSDDTRAEFKQWVSLYHDRIRDAVGTINKIRARSTKKPA